MKLLRCSLLHISFLCVTLLLTTVVAHAQTAIVLQGTVTDRNTGAPLAGVSVNGGCGSTVTDANGGYSFNAQQLCNNATGAVFFQGAGYYQRSAPYTITASPTILDVTLLPGGTLVQGTVTDASTQAGVVGATVSICFGTNFCDFGIGTTTGAGGQYAFDSSHLHESFANGFNVYGVNASATGYFNYSAFNNNGTPLFPVSPPSPATYNFQMIQESGVVLQGTVTDRNTGAPLAGVSVNGGCGSTVTDANGGYSFNAQQLCNNATGAVFFQGAGYYQRSAPYTITASPTILDVTLLPGGTLVQGTVTDASTQAGVVGATVSICFGTNFCDFGIGTTTGAGGQYAFDSSHLHESFANGFNVYGVNASATGYFNYSAFNNNGTPLFPVSPPSPATYNFQMSSTGATPRSITITTNPPGLNITVDGTPLVSPQRYDWTPSNAHTIATSTPQPGGPGTRYAFSSWSDGGAISHTIVVPDANAVYTASFATQYELTTSVSPSAGGTITAGGWFAAGGQVSIQATANSGYTFTGFSGDLTGTTNPQNLAMNGPKSVVANFVSTATPAPTSTALTSSLNPSTFGQPVSFTATVSSSSGVPIGLVTFKDGATSLGTVTLNGSGQASFSTAALAVGAHTITAVYAGSLNFATSTSGTLTQTVNRAASTTTLTSSANPSALGQAVTFTATVSGAGGVPTGTVTFLDGNTSLGTGTLNPSGQATFSTSSLATGSHNIKAVYGGDGTFLGSNSGTLKQTVQNITTTTTLSSSLNPSLVGQAVTFTAQVTSSSGGIPTGTVTFKDAGKTLGTATLNASGQASFSTSSLKKGSHKITAVYGGNATFATSTSATLTQVVQ